MIFPHTRMKKCSIEMGVRVAPCGAVPRVPSASSRNLFIFPFLSDNNALKAGKDKHTRTRLLQRLDVRWTSNRIDSDIIGDRPRGACLSKRLSRPTTWNRRDTARNAQKKKKHNPKNLTMQPSSTDARNFSTPFAASAVEGVKRRATLSDTENLAVGAFGGVLETVIQSECAF